MNDDFISSSIATGIRSPMLAGGGGGAGGVAGGGVGPSMLSMSLAAETIKSRGPSHGRRNTEIPRPTQRSRAGLSLTDSRGASVPSLRWWRWSRLRTRGTLDTSPTPSIFTVGKAPPWRRSNQIFAPSDELTREETRNGHHIADIGFRLSGHGPGRLCRLHLHFRPKRGGSGVRIRRDFVFFLDSTGY